MLRPRLSWLLIFVPLSLGARFVLGNDTAVFVTAALAIVPLAGTIGRATDQAALHVGPRLGGLLNASLGNVAELLIAIFLILDDQFEIVKASLTGSIVGNLLLVLGLSFLLGGLRHSEQTFNERAAGTHVSSMTLAVIGLLMPAVFAVSQRTDVVQREVVSGVVAGILIALYAAALLFSLKTHEHLFRTPAAEETPEWSKAKAIWVLVGAIAFVALESEMLAGAIEHASERLGLTKLFVGLIIVPIVGNAAEHSAAIVFAMKNKMDITLEIAIGSSIQMALFVAPAMVLLSMLLGHPMDFVFTPFEIAAVALSTLIMGAITRDGRSDWLEGAQLVGAYAIMAVSFLFLR